jgi:hypothetical protein
MKIKAATQKQYDKAISIYEKNGQYAVYEYAKEQGITSWDMCDMCEDRTPNTEDSCCLVCGTLKD